MLDPDKRQEAIKTIAGMLRIIEDRITKASERIKEKQRAYFSTSDDKAKNQILDEKTYLNGQHDALMSLRINIIDSFDGSVK